MPSSALQPRPHAGELPDSAPAVTEPLLVLKFGSSVLRTADDLPSVAGELYRRRRDGNRIIAVVSALAGETDRLFDEAAAVGAGTDCGGRAELVSLGEERTAALLRIACDRIGLRSLICRAEELGLHCSGSEIDADFTELTPFALARKLDACGLVIVPGFVGLGDHGERRLLGRGGSDLTAAILGAELGAETVRLYKDVDGVFDRDPALDKQARKFEAIPYDDALRVAGRLVHSKAVEFAAARSVPIEVESIGSSRPTRIGAHYRIAPAESGPARVRVALAGYGVVGQAVAHRLGADPRFEIVSILVRDVDRRRLVAPPTALCNDVNAFTAVDADVVVELLSCADTGAAICCHALKRGVPVVTASKQVVSNRFDDLRSSLAAGGASLLYSAAVAGSAPLLEAIDREKERGELLAVRGILNGTVNFVLERLVEGLDLETSLAIARTAGFAEEDSKADLSGADAAAKLKLIGHRAFGLLPEAVEVTCEPLSPRLAAGLVSSGERWLQVSEVRRTGRGVEASVRLCPAAAAGIPAMPNEWNVGIVEARNGRLVEVKGRGAGGPATAEAVLADLYQLFGAAQAPGGTLRERHQSHSRRDNGAVEE